MWHNRVAFFQWSQRRLAQWRLASRRWKTFTTHNEFSSGWMSSNWWKSSCMLWYKSNITSSFDEIFLFNSTEAINCNLIFQCLLMHVMGYLLFKLNLLLFICHLPLNGHFSFDLLVSFDGSLHHHLLIMSRNFHDLLFSSQSISQSQLKFLFRPCLNGVNLLFLV